MSDTNRCLLVPASQRAFAQQLCKAAGGPQLDNMWLAGCSATGNTPATWYVIEGMVPTQIAALFPLWTVTQNLTTLVQTSVGDAATITAAAVAGGMVVTLAQVQALFALVDITQQNVWVAIGRLNLQRISGVS